MRKQKLIIVSFLLVCAMVAMSACSAASELPEIKITSGDIKIPNTVVEKHGLCSIFDRAETFMSIMKNTELAELPYIKLGEEITIEVLGDTPDVVMLTGYILKSDGSLKYASEVNQEVDIEFSGNKGSFVLDVDMAYSLVSQAEHHNDGNVISGFCLGCTWGDNYFEYDFIIRTDAGLGEDA